LGLKKHKNKLSDEFGAHCIDSWVLANDYVGGNLKPDNMKIMFIIPLTLRRRQLHKACPSKGGIRKPYGGTRSLGFKKGSLIKYRNGKIYYIGGYSNNRGLSTHSIASGKRGNRDAKPEHCKFLTYLSWRWRSN
jgi:hypothetical protein